MKTSLFALLFMTSFSALANDITEKIPEGRYLGKNKNGTCWVSVSTRSNPIEARVHVSKVAPNVSPGPGESLDFVESAEYEIKRVVIPEGLTIINLISPNDSYSRKKESKLEIAADGDKKTVKVSTREKFMGFWTNKEALDCNI